jgi:hypothetical protein
MTFHCSAARPWGVHPELRNDQDCPRCGWTAPGPVGDAREDAEVAAAEAFALAAMRGWVVHAGDQVPGTLAA